MPYNNFIVKNGITVNGSFTANSTVVNAAALNATSVNATSYTIASGAFYANSTTVNTANVLASTTVNIGANVVANTTTLFVGNTSVNTTITAGAVSINGTSIATMITGNAATAYANAVANSAALYAPLAGAVFTGQVNTTAINVTGSANIGGNLTVSGNLTLSGSTTFVNSTVITTTDKAFYLANTSTALAADGGGIYIGNNVASFLWNNATSSLQSNVALLPSTNNILLGGATNLWNLNANTVNAVSVIIGGTNVNSAINTAYSNAIANSAAMLTANVSTLQSQITGNSATAYANAVANSAAMLNANVTTLNTAITGNAATAYANAVANSAAMLNANVTTLNTAITGNAATAYANAVANAAALYQTTAGLSGNVAALTSNNSIYHNGVSLSTLQTQITSNAAAAYANAVANAAAIYAPLASPVFSTNTLTIGTATYSVANGNFGIGTTLPASALHVVGETYSTTGFATTVDPSYFTPSGLSAIPNYGIGAPGSSFVSLAGYAGLTFYTNQSERMRLTSTGNFGVGTTSPSSRLAVQASANNIDTFTVGASDFSHYFTIKPETSANTAIIGYWNGTAWANLVIGAAYVSLPSNVLINGAQAATQSYVTGLGFANATNGAAITSSQVTTGLGYTPYNSTNPSGYITSSALSSYAPLTGSGAYGSWGISITGSAVSITGTYGGSLTSSQVTTGLGYTPYNSTNPSGYITSSALSSYAALSAATSTFTGSIISGSSVSQANTNSANIVSGSSFAVGGNGGNYLAFGQSTTYTQWIQSGYNASSQRWAINLNPLGGNVGVNMGTNTDPSYNLDVNGKARVSSSLGVGSAAPQSTIGQIVASDNIIAYFSDARLKENIAPIPDALAKINTLSGVTYNSNDLAESYGYTDRSQQVGVLAQEVKVVMPQVIKPAPFDTDGEGNSISGQNYMTVQYEKLVPLLIEAIKELTAKVNDLESKLGSN